MTDRPIFIDIDGTLTTKPFQMWGPVIDERLDAVRRILHAGHQVVLWSGGGTAYARQFAHYHKLEGVIPMGKPEFCIDDNPDIRPPERMPIHGPEFLD